MGRQAGRLALAAPGESPTAAGMEEADSARRTSSLRLKEAAGCLEEVKCEPGKHSSARQADSGFQVSGPWLLTAPRPLLRLFGPFHQGGLRRGRPFQEPGQNGPAGGRKKELQDEPAPG